jgi:hypothetical protein
MNIQNLKERWKGWKEKRFLENYGCNTWREYELKYDSDYNPRGNRLKKDQYHGYSHVYIMTRVPDSFQAWDYHFTVAEIAKWCESNCRGKWRHDWHRIIEDVWEDGEWNENGISGLDAVCFAFKDSRDFTMFALKWS